MNYKYILGSSTSDKSIINGDGSISSNTDVLFLHLEDGNDEAQNANGEDIIWTIFFRWEANTVINDQQNKVKLFIL